MLATSRKTRIKECTLKLLLSLFLILNMTSAMSSDAKWTSLKACRDGYDVQVMTGWINGNYETKYVMSVRRESAKSILNQLDVKFKLNSRQREEIQMLEVTTSNFGNFEGVLSFGKVVSKENNFGREVELKIYDDANNELANYYFFDCY